MTRQSQSHKRRRKLILPSWQLRMIGAFTGIALLALMAEFLALAAKLTQFAAEMAEGGHILSAELPTLLAEVLVTALLVLLPAILGIGILVTFRTAGPLYRFKTYLKEYVEDRDEGPCRIRKGDELQELCTLINEALEHAQRRGAREERKEELVEA